MIHQQTQPLIVFLSGWAGSGKDAAATLMVEEMGFTRHAFADSLKEDVATRTNIPVATFHSHYAKNRPLEAPSPMYPTALTPRDLLIQHAAAARAANPDIYAEDVARSIGASHGQLRHVISDWRYPNEFDHIRGTMGDTATLLRIRVHRDSVIPIADPTEHYLDTETMDAVILNNGHISDLRDDIKTILYSYLHPVNTH
jgi:hypothetical protein